MCVLKADFPKLFFTSLVYGSEGRAGEGATGNLLCDTPAKIVLESAFYGLAGAVVVIVVVVVGPRKCVNV